MTTIKLICTGAMARATVDGPLTHGMVGVPVDVEWDAAWDGLMKTVKFRCGDVSRTAIVDGDATVTVPHECLIAGQWLAVGMDGWDADGTLRIPSSWASCGVVKPSVAQVDAPEGAPPTLDTVAQLQLLVNKAATAAGELSGAADAAAISASDADKSAREAKEALDKTAEIAVNTPYIGANYNWIIWDAEKASYVDSGVGAVGPQGPIGPSGLTGPQGPQGVPGNDGSDANVTADNIRVALGFDPADSEDVNQIKDDLADKIDKPATAPEVGKILKVTAVNDDGTFTCEWADDPSGGGAVDDVTVNGVSIVQGATADIPVGNGKYSGFALWPTAATYAPVYINAYGKMVLEGNASHLINRRKGYASGGWAVKQSFLDEAVEAALCDGIGPTWTAEEQAAAQQRLGILSVEEVLF